MSRYLSRIQSISTNIYFVFVVYFLFIFVILLLCNQDLFIRRIFEHGDFAANSILINQAKSFDLLVGNYSRFMFNHPGPGLLYIQAFFEILLYDTFHIVPTPFNAHLISILFLNSILLSLAVCIIYKHFKSQALIFASIAIILVYCGLNKDNVLSSTWMPHVYFVLFLVFLIACASLSSGNLSSLWIIALTGGLLVHGHVSFIAFVIPATMTAFILALRRSKLNVRQLIENNKSEFIVFGIVLLILLLPIVINLVMDFPGDIGKYIEYASSKAVHHPTLRGAFSFLASFYNNQILLAILIIISSGVCIFYIEKEKNKRGFLINIVLFNLIATVFFVYYVCTGMDSLDHYMGIFFGSVPLLFIITNAITLCKFMEKGIVRKSILFAISISILLASLHAGSLTNNYMGVPYLQDVTNTIETNANNKKVLLHIQDHDSWPWATGLVVALERKKVDVLLDNPWWGFMFTKNHVVSTETLPKDYWCLTIKKGSTSGSGVIFSNDDVSIVETKYTSSYIIGNMIDFSISGNSKSYTVTGWSDGEAWGTWTDGAYARLMFFINDVDMNIDKVLVVKANPFVNEVNPRLYVDIIANGTKVGQWVFSKGGEVEQRVVIPTSLMTSDGSLFISFEVHNPISPYSLGLSKDNRMLGLGISNLVIIDSSSK